MRGCCFSIYLFSFCKIEWIPWAKLLVLFLCSLIVWLTEFTWLAVQCGGWVGWFVAWLWLTFSLALDNFMERTNKTWNLMNVIDMGWLFEEFCWGEYAFIKVRLSEHFFLTPSDDYLVFFFCLYGAHCWFLVRSLSYSQKFIGSWWGYWPHLRKGILRDYEQRKTQIVSRICTNVIELGDNGKC